MKKALVIIVLIALTLCACISSCLSQGLTEDARESVLPLSINPELFLARKIPNGFSWTLASRLGRMLSLAENMFGPHDSTYAFLGVEFSYEGPQTWYPGGCRHIAIQLGVNASMDLAQACYQLAHECIHLLAPTGVSGANNLEEGMATYFASYYMASEMNQPTWQPIPESFKKVKRLVETLMRIDPNGIKRIRGYQPAISKISVKMLQKEFPGLSRPDAEFLVSRFVGNP